MEASGFRDAYEAIAELDALVIGISGDGVERLRRFHQSCRLPFHLAADTEHVVARLYEARRRFNLGTARLTYVIDKTGVVRNAFRSEISMSGHIDRSLETLKELAG